MAQQDCSFLSPLGFIVPRFDMKKKGLQEGLMVQREDSMVKCSSNVSVALSALSLDGPWARDFGFYSASLTEGPSKAC